MKKRRFLTLLLLSSIILASCGGSEGSTDTVDTSADTTTEALTGVDTYTEVAAKDYGGRTFHFWYNGNDFEPNQDVNATELNGETLNDAIFKRNEAIAEKYNIVITSEFVSDMARKILNSVSAGDNAVDVALELPGSTFAAAQEGAFANINDIPHLSFDMPWWDETMRADMEIDGFNYCAISSMNIHAYGATPVVVFNKKLAEDFGVENLYKVVEEGRWTIDYMISTAKGIISDVNGDTKYDLNDMYGFIANNFCVDCLIGGSGWQVVTKDESGELKINLTAERFYDIYNKIRELTLLDNGAYLTDRYHGAHKDEEIEILFEDNRALFWVTNLKGVQRRRRMEGDFGVLPMPKIDDQQDKYYSHLQGGIGDAIHVPTTCEDIDMMGRILEDFAYYSYKDVIPAFYEVTLKGKAMRDDESAATLDILLDNYYYDIGMLMGIVNQFRSPVTSNDENIVSFIEARINGYENSIEKLNTAFED